MSQAPDQPEDVDPGSPAPSRRRDEPSDSEIDRRFAELTAGWTTEPSQVEDRPGDRDGGSAHAVRAEDEAAPPPPAPEREEAPESSALRGPRDYAVADELDDGFTPPEPEPLASADPLLVAAWLSAVGGPIAFIVILIVWSNAPALVWLSTLAVTLLGWAVVIWRLPRTREDTDDDGAVV